MTSVTQLYNVNQLTPGMELGQPVLNQKGTVLLAEGTVLNKALLDHLSRLGVESVSIKETLLQQSSEITLDQKSLELLNQAIEQIKSSFHTIEKYGKVPMQIFENIVANHIGPLVNSHSAANFLNIDRPKSDYLYNHSINVGLLSGLIGKWLGSSEEEISALILTGLLHDIGKTQIPQDVINKTGKLTPKEMELVKLHATYSYRLLNDLPNIPPTVKFGILQHHERLDGSGYPGRFKDDKVHRFARIVAIADIYCAMTADREHSEKSNPFAAAEVLAKDMYSKLDTEICTTFLTNFCTFIIGNKLQLEDGREVEIVYTGHFLNLNPLVRTAEGEILTITNWRSIRKMTPFHAKLT